MPPKCSRKAEGVSFVPRAGKDKCQQEYSFCELPFLPWVGTSLLLLFFSQPKILCLIFGEVETWLPYICICGFEWDLLVYIYICVFFFFFNLLIHQNVTSLISLFWQQWASVARGDILAVPRAVFSTFIKILFACSPRPLGLWPMSLLYLYSGVKWKGENDRS